MTGHERSVLAATCVSSLGSFYTMAVTGFALPQVQRGLTIPEDEVGSLFALLRFGALFSLVLAVLADRMGRRRLLIVSVAGCALCNIATAFTQSGLQFAWLQLGSRLFLGGPWKGCSRREVLSGSTSGASHSLAAFSRRVVAFPARRGQDISI